VRALLLLRLYPRGWRERYGDEFLALAGDRALSPTQVIDVVSGAIDAWLSADVRRHTSTRPVPEGGTMVFKAFACDRTGVTPADGLIGAGIMIALAVVSKLIAAAALHDGYAAVALGVKELSFPISFTASMPFWLMKGQPWKAQVVIVGTTLALLVALSFTGR
jgi:hypothetical protein